MEKIFDVNYLKAIFFKDYYDRYERFLCSYEINSYIINLIDDWGKENKWSSKRINELENTKLNVNDEVDKRQIQASVEEFFEIISTNDNAANYIASIMNFTGNETGFYNLLNEDRIIRPITRHFWGKLTDEGRNWYNNKLTKYKSKKIDDAADCILMEFDEETIKDRKTGLQRIKDLLTEKKIYPEEQLNDEATDCSSIIKIASFMMGKDAPWAAVGKMLYIRNFLRNLKDHRIIKIAVGNRKAVVWEHILFTYIATVLALRTNLTRRKYLKEEDIDYHWPKRELYVFFEPQNEVREYILHKEDGSIIEAESETKEKKYKKYLLDYDTTYYLQTKREQSVSYNDNILTRCLMIAIWNGNSFDFANDWESVNSDNYQHINKALINTVIDTGEQIRKAIDDQTSVINTGFTKVIDTQKELSEKNMAQRKKYFWILLSIITLALGIYLYLHFESQSITSIDKETTIEAEPYEQSYIIEMTPWGSSEFRTFICDSVTIPKSATYQFDSLGFMKNLKLVSSYKEKELEYNCPDKRTIVSKYNGRDSVALADFDETNKWGLPTSGHLEVRETLEALSFDADYGMNTEETDLEYIRFNIFKSTAIDLYENVGEQTVPAGWGDQVRTVVIRYFYNKYSNLEIEGKFKDIVFCPDVFNTILPGGIGFRIATRIGKLAHHIPDYCNIEIEDHGHSKKYYRLEFEPRTNNEQLIEIVYTMRYYGEHSNYGSSSGFPFLKYKLPKRLGR